jgi:hypothetical protein
MIVSYTEELTNEEIKLIAKLIGNTSHETRMRCGLTATESGELQVLYKQLAETNNEKTN